jgi:DNA-binding transcriptional LysR family regulator
LRDLREARWIALAEEEVPGFKILMTQIMRPAQFTPKFGRKAQSLAGMLAFIGLGEGIALIPELFLAAQPDGLRYVATDCAPFEMFAVWSKTKPHPHVKPYLEILREKMAAVKLPQANLRQRPRRRAAGA